MDVFSTVKKRHELFAFDDGQRIVYLLDLMFSATDTYPRYVDRDSISEPLKRV